MVRLCIHLPILILALVNSHSQFCTLNDANICPRCSAQHDFGRRFRHRGSICDIRRTRAFDTRLNAKASSGRHRLTTYECSDRFGLLRHGEPYESSFFNVDRELTKQWLASGSCTSDSCAQSKMLFDDSNCLDSGVDVSINYQSGSVEGEIFWEQLTLGSFQIGYQAFSGSSGSGMTDKKYRPTQSPTKTWRMATSLGY